MEVEAPCRRLEQRCRDDLAVVGEDAEFRAERQRPSATASGDRNRSGVRTAQTHAPAAAVAIGVGHPLPARRWPWRRGHDADELDPSASAQPSQAWHAEPAAAEEDGPYARAAGPPVRHARALVASRTSASSSLPGADRHQLVHRVEVVDVELAVEVVELVLERATEQPGPRHLDLLPVAILGDDPDPLAACHVRDVPGMDRHPSRSRSSPVDRTIRGLTSS